MELLMCRQHLFANRADVQNFSGQEDDLKQRIQTAEGRCPSQDDLSVVLTLLSQEEEPVVYPSNENFEQSQEGDESSAPVLDPFSMLTVLSQEEPVVYPSNENFEQSQEGDETSAP